MVAANDPDQYLFFVPELLCWQIFVCDLVQPT